MDLDGLGLAHLFDRELVAIGVPELGAGMRKVGAVKVVKVGPAGRGGRVGGALSILQRREAMLAGHLEHGQFISKLEDIKNKFLQLDTCESQEEAAWLSIIEERHRPQHNNKLNKLPSMLTVRLRRVDNGGAIIADNRNFFVGHVVQHFVFPFPV